MAHVSLHGGPVTRQVWFALLALAAGAPLDAQSLMYRPPDLSGTWVSDGGVVQFNFVHRFHVFPGPTNTVINYPTFTLAAGIGHNIDFGLRFGTKSSIPSSGNSTNESELFARWRVLGGPEGKEGFAVAVTPAYNKLAKSADGEVGIDWTRGPLTLSGAARGMSEPLGAAHAGAPRRGRRRRRRRADGDLQVRHRFGHDRRGPSRTVDQRRPRGAHGHVRRHRRRVARTAAQRHVHPSLRQAGAVHLSLHAAPVHEGGRDREINGKRETGKGKRKAWRTI